VNNGDKTEFLHFKKKTDSYVITYKLVDMPAEIMSDEIFFETEELCQKEFECIGVRKKNTYDKTSHYGYLRLQSENHSFMINCDEFAITAPPENLLFAETKHYTHDCDGEMKDDEASIKKIANGILNDPALPMLKHIRIGVFATMWEDTLDKWYTILANYFITNKEKLQHIESLYIGDVGQCISEISWLHNGNYGELLKSLPNLKSFTMKGMPGKLAPEGEIFTHPSLETLEIISGGLFKHIPETLKNSQLPKLQKLILYIGVDNYGLDFEIDKLAELAKSNLFPNLIYLGFVNSEEQDKIAKIILESDILHQLEFLDLSFGTLTDKGGEILLENAYKLLHLKQVKIEHHFLSDEMVEKLKLSQIKVCISDGQEADNYGDEIYYYPMITE